MQFNSSQSFSCYFWW